MSRGVSYATGSEIIVYETLQECEDEWESRQEWDAYVDCLKSRLKDKYSSLEECDKWLDREDHAILENYLVYIGISEYCGVVSIWVVPKDGNYTLAMNWIETIKNGFNNSFGELIKIGHASNGEAFYRKKE